MELDQLGRDTVADGARLALDRWERLLAAPADPAPGLVALLDQHTARIRASVEPLSAVNLASYADGVADVAAANGWSPSAGLGWVSLRLLAVCALARTVA